MLADIQFEQPLTLWYTMQEILQLPWNQTILICVSYTDNILF
jgi:hypothetical protein